MLKREFDKTLAIGVQEVPSGLAITVPPLPTATKRWPSQRTRWRTCVVPPSWRVHVTPPPPEMVELVTIAPCSPAATKRCPSVAIPSSQPGAPEACPIHGPPSTLVAINPPAPTATAIRSAVKASAIPALGPGVRDVHVRE